MIASALQHQCIAAVPQMQRFAIGLCDRTQRAEAKADGAQVSHEANPLGVPRKRTSYTSVSGR